MSLDAFYTPQDLALSLVFCLPIRPGDIVMEPSVGGGAWLQAVHQVHPRTYRVAMDIDEQAPGLHLGPKVVDEARVGDFLTWRPKAWTAAPHWIVGNPPYSRDADMEHVAHALRVVREGGNVAMLLHLSFLASAGRWHSLFRSRRPRGVVVLPNRVRFGGPADLGMAGKRDSALVWWDLSWSGPTSLAWLDPATMIVDWSGRALPQE